MPLRQRLASWKSGAGFRIGRNAASILVSGAGAEVFDSYTAALTALMLGAAAFGMLSAAQAFMEPFSTLSLFGLGVVSMTVAARRGGCDGVLAGTMAGLHTVFALAASVLAMTSALVLGRASMLPLLAILCFNLVQIPINAPSNLPVQYDQAMHRFLLIPAATAALRLGLAYVAVYWHNTPVGYQIAATVGGLLGTFLVFRVSRRWYPLRWSFDRVLAWQLVRLAWPAAVLEFVVMFYSKASYFFLQSAGPQVQGQYAVADRLCRPVLTIASALVASSLPSVARLAASGDAGKLWRVYRTSVVRSLQVLAPLAIVAGFAAPWALRKFVPEYGSAGLPFQVLLIGVLFMFLNQISSMFIIGIGGFRLIMSVALVNLVVYLVLAVQWIPRYRATGAALSTTVMEGVNCFVQLLILAFLLRKKAHTPRSEP